MGKSRVGRVFLRQENLLRGRYFAELTRELFDNLVRFGFGLGLGKTSWALG